MIVILNIKNLFFEIISFYPLWLCKLLYLDTHSEQLNKKAEFYFSFS